MMKSIFGALLLAAGMTAMAAGKTPQVVYQVEVRSIDLQGRETIVQSVNVVALEGQSTPLDLVQESRFLIGCNPDATAEECAKKADVQRSGFNVLMTPVIKSGAIQTQFRISVFDKHQMGDISVAGQRFPVKGGTSMSMETDVSIPNGENVVINLDGSPTMKKYRFVVQAKAI